MFNQEWTIKEIAKDLNRSEKKIQNNIVNALKFIGEQTLNKIRNVRTYQDQTGNLRASTGYRIYQDGKVYEDNTPYKTNEAREGVNYLYSQIDPIISNKGFVLVVHAGMDYAAWVEAKGYDVITGSAPSRREMIKDFKQLL